MSTKSRALPDVTVLGAGLMGHGIAQEFLVAGARVTVWDPDRHALESVPSRIAGHLEMLGIECAADVVLSVELDQAVAGAQLVVEAAPERLEIKRELVSTVQKVNPKAIFASNTSVLRISEIAEGAARPDLVVGTHWWNPPYLIKLVELVRGEETSRATMMTVHGWLTNAGKTVVEVLRDEPGFVGNRMQFALMREAAHIVEEGIASAETVDTVVRETLGRRWGAVGPLRNADFIGLDLVSAIMDYLAPSLSVATSAPDLFRDQVELGKLGAKSGSGIYEWADGDQAAWEQTLLNHLMVSNEETSPTHKHTLNRGNDD